MDQFRSPNEITTFFLALTIGFYVFLFWRSQIQGNVQPNRRKPNSKPQIHPRRRSGDAIKRFNDEDTGVHTATNH